MPGDRLGLGADACLLTLLAGRGPQGRSLRLRLGPRTVECGDEARDGTPMDSLITVAARALAAGDPLGALKRVALRDGAPALALRGVAMAQLGDLVRAKALLKRAARAFGPKEAVARARCVVAEAEVALASRDLGWPAKALDAARATLDAQGDRLNAAHARYLEVRRLLVLGRLDEAEERLVDLDPASFPPALRAAHQLVVVGIEIRRLRTATARVALVLAERAAREAGIPAPGNGGDSGLTWAEGTLWVGQHRDRKIHQIDPETGAVLRTIESNRFVTGVTWVDGELWHATWEGEESELRRIDPETGTVLEQIEMPPGANISGLESDGGDRFFCGGGKTGKIRAVRRPRRSRP